MTTASPPLLIRRLGPAQLLLLDAVLAVGLALLCWYAASEAPAAPATGLDEPPWLSVLVGAALGLPVAVRRRWPLAVVAAVLAVGAVALFTGVIPDYAASAPILALATVLYIVGVALPRNRSVATLGVCIAVTAGALTFAADSLFGPGAAGVVFAVLVLGAGWVVGRAVRERRAYAARTVEQATDRAVNDERLRIAREMHDIVAHSMSLIAVKAAIANHVADERPQEVRDALRIIESTSRGALAELRRTLGALRTETEFAPTPGLAELPSLAERAESAGVVVELNVQGDADVPEGVGLSVFRIVQESLTNVVKHAAPARCRVEVVNEPGAVRVVVTDDGRRIAAPTAGGQGLIGMRERVALYRGEFDAGPRTDGGFAVHVRLPYGPYGPEGRAA